jgi:hypothetical protein
MKRYVLQASWHGGRPPERFVTSCDDGVDYLVGVKLVRSRQGSEDKVVLFDKKTGELAALVVCKARQDTLPIFLLPLNDMKRLLLMPRAEVTLVELADEVYESDGDFFGTKTNHQVSPERNELTLTLKAKSFVEGVTGISFHPFGTPSKEKKSDSQASTAPIIRADEGRTKDVTPQKRPFLKISTNGPEDLPFYERILLTGNDSSKAASPPDDRNRSEKGNNSPIGGDASTMNQERKRTKRAVGSSGGQVTQENTGNRMTSTYTYGATNGEYVTHPQPDVTSEKKGWVMSTVTKSWRWLTKTQEQKRIIPNPLKNWTEYASAVLAVNSAVTADGDSAVKTIADHVNSLFRNEDCALPHLSLAAYVCNIKPEADTGALQLSILRRLSQNLGWNRVGISDFKKKSRKTP